MSRLVILFLTLTLLSGSSEAGLPELFEQMEQAVITFKSIITAPLRLLNSFLGIGTELQKLPNKRITAEVHDDSDVITIIKSPTSPIAISHILRAYSPNAGENVLGIFQSQSGAKANQTPTANNGGSILDLPGQVLGSLDVAKIPEQAATLAGEVTNGLTSGLNELTGEVTNGVTNGLTGLTNGLTSGLNELTGGLSGNLSGSKQTPKSNPLPAPWPLG